MRLIRRAALAVLVTTVAVAPAAAGPLTIWDFALFGGGGVTTTPASAEARIGNSVVVRGMVGSNEDVLMTQDAKVFGNVWAGRNFTGGSNIEVAGNVVANGEVDINGIVNGDVHSGSGLASDNTKTSLLLRSDAGINGDVFTKNNLEFNSHSNIDISGNATFGGVLMPNSGLANPNHPSSTNDIFGTMAGGSTTGLQAFSPLVVVPSGTAFTASSLAADDRSCTGGGCATPLTLAPGTYRNLDIGSDKQLNLSSGDYYFNKITANSGLDLYLDLSSGNPLNIYVVDVANFGQNQTVFVKRPGDSGYTQIDLLADTSIAGLVYLETKKTFNINANSQWVGTVFASVFEAGGDEAYFGTGINIWGAAYAYDSVDIHQDSVLNYVRSYRAPAATTAVPEPATLMLLGSGLIGAAMSRRRRARA